MLLSVSAPWSVTLSEASCEKRVHFRMFGSKFRALTTGLSPGKGVLIVKMEVVWRISLKTAKRNTFYSCISLNTHPCFPAFLFFTEVLFLSQERTLINIYWFTRSECYLHFSALHNICLCLSCKRQAIHSQVKLFTTDLLDHLLHSWLQFVSSLAHVWATPKPRCWKAMTLSRTSHRINYYVREDLFFALLYSTYSPWDLMNPEEARWRREIEM